MKVTSTETKKALIQAGIEVYRTRGDAVHVAERVRENLIMDACIRVESAGPAVLMVVRSQRSDFPGDGEEALFQRAFALTEPARARGYVEVDRIVTPVNDPSDPSRTLDLWCEISLRLMVEDLAAAIEEVRFALTLDKVVAPR